MNIKASQRAVARSYFQHQRRVNPQYYDYLFLTLAVWLSLILYLGGLGFYLDDWNFLAVFTNSSDQSLLGLSRSIYSAQPWARMRPVQLLNLAWLYWVFGLNPLGYHITNALVLNVMVLLFYQTLLRLSQSRLLVVIVPLVYTLLPNYSTDRFWVAAFQANLSLALYFASFSLDLRALRGPSARFWRWKQLSVFCLLGSILAYEITLPLFLLNLLILWYRTHRLSCTQADNCVPKSTLVASSLVTLSGLILVTAFKVLVTERANTEAGVVNLLTSNIRRLLDFNYHYYDGVYGLNIKQAVAVNYVSYGFGLPRVVWRILHNYFDWSTLIVSAVLGLIIFFYLYGIIKHQEVELPGKGCWLKIIFLGLVVFALGYAIFLTTTDIRLATTDHSNRTNIAAAVGVAMTLVGGIGFVSGLLPPSFPRRIFFCVMVTLLCTSGCLIINTLAGFWTAAYSREKEILSDVHRNFPNLAFGSTLILDGFCPREGPAVVFRYNWDLEGALQTLYHDTSLRAAIITPRLDVEDEGISESLGGETIHYRYGERLLVYNVSREVIYPLIDAETARGYLQAFHPNYKAMPDPEEARRAFRTFNPDAINDCLELGRTRPH
jgi:hypothetical protein